MGWTIGKAVPTDAAEILEYLKTVGSETDFLLFGAEGVPFTLEQEEEFIRTTNSSDKSVMLLARDGDVIVGNGLFRGSIRERIAHRGEIALSVRKDYWGRGIGSALMEALIAFAKDEAGVEVISLEVLTGNARAIALYRKFGFERYGAFRKFHKVRGEYRDADCMNLYL